MVTVADTGHGMSAEDIATAFEPYFSTKETGFGLGLALTRKIVTDHGGLDRPGERARRGHHRAHPPAPRARRPRARRPRAAVARS